MTKWKGRWWRACRQGFRHQRFAGFLYLDWGQARNLAAFARVRLGLSGAAPHQAVVRLISFHRAGFSAAFRSRSAY